MILFKTKKSVEKDTIFLARDALLETSVEQRRESGSKNNERMFATSNCLSSFTTAREKSVYKTTTREECIKTMDGEKNEGGAL